MLPLTTRVPTLDEPLAFLRACHRRIEERIQILERAVAAFAEPGHPQWLEAMDAVQMAFAYFEESGRRHAEDEERSLFPRLRRVDGCGDVLDALERDHREEDALRHELGAIARGLREPNETPVAVARLPEIVAAFGRHFRAHIRTEEEQVLPRAERLLSAEDLAAIAAEMRERRGPAKVSHGRI
jgi:hemerythrin-like domain-containing protein